jgi:hypothetical protein
MWFKTINMWLLKDPQNYQFVAFNEDAKRSIRGISAGPKLSICGIKGKSKLSKCGFKELSKQFQNYQKVVGRSGFKTINLWLLRFLRRISSLYPVIKTVNLWHLQ